MASRLVRGCVLGFALGCAFLGSGVSWAQAEGTPPRVADGAYGAYVFPHFTRAAQVTATCARLLADTRQQHQRIEATAPGQVLGELDALARLQEDMLGPLVLLSAVHPHKPLRDASEACDLRYQALAAAFQQNRKVYELLRRVQPADAIDQRFLQERLDAMEDGGVALAPAQRAQLRKLAARIAALTQTFDRRIREDKTRIAFTRAQLDGVPQAVWKAAPRDAQGRHLLGLDYPTYTPVVETATHPDTRERIWRASQNHAGWANVRTLAQLVRLRHEQARLLGHASYADLMLRRRMAGSEAGVQGLLAEVRQVVTERELSDLQTLRQAKADELRQPLQDVTLQRWDVGYYLARVRQQRHQFDAEQFRAYLPTEASIAFLFELATRMFGLRFEPQAQPVWHADVRAYAVFDIDTGRNLGQLLIDPFPRDGKYNHAAVWGVRASATSVGRTATAALVTNIDRTGLTLAELEGLLHEFGHAMHVLLSQTRHASQGGLNSLLDFVEAPSQMLEEWVYDPQVLALFQKVCDTCKPVPPELLAQADHARHFGKGVWVARQHLYSRYDLALHGRTPAEPMVLWRSMEAATPLGHVPDSLYPASFSHMAGGYAAGYYSYLWSLVLADDIRTAFTPDKLDPAVGRRYRREVLAPGAQEHPTQLLRRFLGREPNSNAFFHSLNRQ